MKTWLTLTFLLTLLTACGPEKALVDHVFSTTYECGFTEQVTETSGLTSYYVQSDGYTSCVEYPTGGRPPGLDGYLNLEGG